MSPSAIAARAIADSAAATTLTEALHRAVLAADTDEGLIKRLASNLATAVDADPETAEVLEQQRDMVMREIVRRDR